jgi:transcriptional regulator GlxA family with amidase domain
MTAFEMTGFGLAKPPPADSDYDLHLLSEHGGPIRSSCGLTVETEAFGDPAFDTIIVGAITAFEMPPSDANLIAFVQKAARASRRTASFCNGAFVLAEAGLLDGRRADDTLDSSGQFQGSVSGCQDGGGPDLYQ